MDQSMHMLHQGKVKKQSSLTQQSGLYKKYHTVVSCIQQQAGTKLSKTELEVDVRLVW